MSNIESSPQPKPRADVAVLTVIKPELSAAKRVFGIKSGQRENRLVNGLRYWEVDHPSDAQTSKLHTVLTMVGESRNLPCAIACERLFATYDVGLCILVGIAAGLEEKTHLGDVVVADIVLDYEGQRSEPNGPKRRPVPYPLEVAISRDLQHFSPDDHDWSSKTRAFLSELDGKREAVPFADSWEPAFHHGVILAGEKLLADGSLPEMRADYHDKVRALEMEGSGFARACREYSIPWLVFRGVSDFGDEEKPCSDSHQTACAIPAAVAASLFIQKDYRKDDRDF